MSHRVLPGCVGCGVCVLACPTGAVLVHAEEDPHYRIDPLRCGDCGACAIVCPVGAIGIDPLLAVCFGHGCPLTSNRLQGTACSQGEPASACPSCGGPQWCTGGSIWSCPACGPSEHHAHCPRPGQLRRLAARRDPAGVTVVATPDD